MTERCLIDNLNTIPWLVLLCMGIVLEDGPIVDKDKEPFCSLKTKHWAPNLPIMRKEVVRRADVLGLKKVKANNWAKTACTEFLMANPIRAEADILFLKRKVEKFRRITLAAANESIEKEKDKVTSAKKQWFFLQINPVSFAPILRLIHCFDDSDVHQAFKNCPKYEEPADSDSDAEVELQMDGNNDNNIGAFHQKNLS